MDRSQDTFTNKSTISVRSGESSSKLSDLVVDIELPHILPTNNKELSNTRIKILLCCIFTLSIYFHQSFSFSHTIYYIFERALRWDRTDMGILLASQLWGAAIGYYISTKYIGKYESKWIIIFANLWLTYFNFFSVFSSFTGFYETWINRVFFAIGEGFIVTTVYRTLINWTPKRLWIATLFCTWTGLGIGYILSQFASVYFVGLYYYVGIVFNSILPIIVAIMWYLPSIQISPHLHPTISKREIDSIKSSAIQVGNNLEITHRTYVTDQKKSSIKAVHYWEVRIIIFSGFLYGSSFLTLFHFNPSYYFDLVTLKPELSELPAIASLPFVIWIIFSLIFSESIHFKQIDEKRGLQSIITIVALIISVIVLFTIEDYASLAINNFKLCIITVCHCITFTYFLSTMIDNPIYSPEVLLGYSLCGYSIGGGFGVIFAGYVLEMSGTWSVICKFSAVANSLNILILIAPLVWKTFESTLFSKKK